MLVITELLTGVHWQNFITVFKSLIHYVMFTERGFFFIEIMLTGMFT